jgi:predicted transcriptional regulator
MTSILMTDSPKRRDKLVIMAEMVTIAKRGTPKTRMMFEANLSFSQLNEYLTLLSNTGLIEKTSNHGKVIFQTTPKGLEFLEKQQQVFNLLNDDTYVCRTSGRSNSAMLFTPSFQGNKKFQGFARKAPLF